jgi:SPP1 gp7 family putative phage head morphogenesis protein
MKLFGYNLTKAAQPATPTKKNKRLSSETIQTPIDRIGMQMDNLNVAIEAARSVCAPNRDRLMLLYDQVAEDSEVKTQMRTAKILITGAPFELRRDKTADEAAAELLQKPWFGKFLEIVLSAEFYGYTLAEFQEFKNGEFQWVEVFDRRHVEPVKKQILLYPGHQTGIPYADNMLNYLLIELGDVKDLGLMRNLAREVIWKTFSLVDWSQFNETFGKPMLHIATDTDDPIEVNKRASMAANFGSNRWLITDADEQVNLIESATKGATGANFEAFATRCDKAIAKLINGQGNAGNEQAFVGSAEVSERILNEYTRDRMKRIQEVINFKLLPFLIYYGYPLDGLQFCFTELDPKKEDIGTGQTNDDAPGTGSEKAQNKFNSFPVLDKKKIYNLKVDKLLESYLKKIWEEGGEDLFDEEVWNLNFKQLTKGVELGYGVDFARASVKDAELAFQLKNNAAVYAAFKNHTEQGKLRDLLIDGNGNLKSWNDFKKDALPLTETYNKTWLETEFNQAEANARMAKKWEGFAANADIYPNLQYRAIIDDKTRDEHRLLNGTILPINDPFWNTHYPPLGWGCRCSVTQTDREVKTKTADIPKASEGFDNNPGKSGKLWSDNNAYASAIDDATKSVIEAKVGKLI